LPPIPKGKEPERAAQLRFRFRVVVLSAASDHRISESFSEPFVVKNPYGDASDEESESSKPF